MVIDQRGKDHLTPCQHSKIFTNDVLDRIPHVNVQQVHHRVRHIASKSCQLPMAMRKQ